MKKDNLQIAHELYRMGNVQQALSICSNLLRKKSDDVEVLSFAGLIYNHLGNYLLAEKLLHQALDIEPQDPYSWFHLGNTRKNLGKIDEAIDCYRKAFDIDPASLQVMNNLGNALREKGQFEEAISYFRKALQIDPNYLNAYNNLGIALLERGDYQEAVKYFEKTIKMNPSYPLFYNNLGIALREQREFDYALDFFRQAVRIDPNFEDARQNLSALLLLLGRFHEGWEEYKWFWRLQGPYHIFQQPLWDGEDIAGKTLLLHAGEGFGDTIQFIRYVPLIAQRGIRVIVGCQKPLTFLLHEVKGITQVITEGKSMPFFDVQSSMFRLPAIFDANIENIPDNVPYIHVDAHLIDKWEKRMIDKKAGLRVGLTWKGGHKLGLYRKRAFPVELFKPCGQLESIVFYSIQKEEISVEGEEQIRNDLNLIDFTEDIGDFADTAAIIHNLDLVITIDTAVAHLAGALGKPVWVLLPTVPDWRWMLNRDDSPWYPTMRLFRQTSPGDWETIAQKVYQELKNKMIND